MDESQVPSDLKDYVVLEFGRVTQSPYYSRVVELAGRMSAYRKEGSGRDQKNFIALTPGDSAAWLEIYDVVQNWKSSRVHFGSFNAHARHRRGTFDCYLARSKAEDGDAYCFEGNWIGCKRITEGRTLELYNHSGMFINEEEFEPDRKFISSRIIDKLVDYSLCPAFKLSRIEQSLSQLPISINVTENENWQPIIEADFYDDTARLIGIRYSVESKRYEAPTISDVDKLEAFSTRRRGFVHEYEDVWEQRIIILRKEQWEEAANSGDIPEVSEMGKKGWSLVNIIPSEGSWYCILQRRRPF